MQFTDLRAEIFEGFVPCLRLARLMWGRFLEMASHLFQLWGQAFGGFVQAGGTQVVDGNLEVTGATFDLGRVGAVKSRLARDAGLTCRAGFALAATALRLHPAEFGPERLDSPHQFLGFVMSTRFLEFSGFAFEFGRLGTENRGAGRLRDRCRHGGGEQGRPKQEQAGAERK
jgi:hypothetical protein